MTKIEKQNRLSESKKYWDNIKAEKLRTIEEFRNNAEKPNDGLIYRMVLIMVTLLIVGIIVS